MDLSNAVDEAAFNGHFEVVKYLAKNKWSTHNTVINAVKGGHFEITKYLLSIDKERLLDLCPSMKEASRLGHIDIVKMLTEMGEPCPKGAIDDASRNGHLDVLRYLIEKGNNNYSSELVDIAAARGQSEIVEYLVQIDAPYSNVALKSGYKSGNLEIVKCLIENDHHVCSSEAVREALEYAAGSGYTEMVKYFVERGIPCTYETVDLAIFSGHCEIVKCFVEDGRPCSDNAIDFAAIFRHFDTVKYLIEKGNRCSFKAINSAATNCHFEIVQLLIENRMEFTLKAIEGAARNGHLEIIKLLMKNLDL